MRLGDRIRAAREALHLTQEELGALCNTTKQTIFKYETGVITNIPLDRLALLSRMLDVTPAYLLGWSENQGTQVSGKLNAVAESFEQLNDEGQDKVVAYADTLVAMGTYSASERVVPFPRITRRSDGFVELKVYDQPAAAGLGNYIDTPDYTVEQYPDGIAPDGTAFGVRISGDSMEPDIPNGCTVFVHPMPAVESGDVGIFVYDGQAYCKKLIADLRARCTVLRSLNSKYDDIMITDEERLRTIGKVLGQYTNGIG